jgi:hypothetical protein
MSERDESFAFFQVLEFIKFSSQHKHQKWNERDANTLEAPANSNKMFSEKKLFESVK